jgi:hypothetical protein
MRGRPRLLAMMGSGETAPTMAKVHRLLADRLGPRPVDAVLLGYAVRVPRECGGDLAARGRILRAESAAAVTGGQLAWSVV